VTDFDFEGGIGWGKLLAYALGFHSWRGEIRLAPRLPFGFRGFTLFTLVGGLALGLVVNLLAKYLLA
jgi:hypothetical protein